MEENCIVIKNDDKQHLWPCWCLRTGNAASEVCAAREHLAAGPKIIWVTCSATWDHGDIRDPHYCWGPTPRSLVLLKLRPVLMSTAHVNTEAHSNQACWSQKAVLSWIQPSLPLGELTQWPRHKRTGFVPCLRGPTANSATSTAHMHMKD